MRWIGSAFLLRQSLLLHTLWVATLPIILSSVHQCCNHFPPHKLSTSENAYNLISTQLQHCLKRPQHYELLCTVQHCITAVLSRHEHLGPLLAVLLAITLLHNNNYTCTSPFADILAFLLDLPFLSRTGHIQSVVRWTNTAQASHFHFIIYSYLVCHPCTCVFNPRCHCSTRTSFSQPFLAIARWKRMHIASNRFYFHLFSLFS